MEGPKEPARIIGRYAVYDAIASGGMATVHFGRLLGPVGFSRTVAIKRLHPAYASDPEFVSMFLDEARLAARIRHPHVVPTLDVVATGGELFLVMDYVPGESMARLIRASTGMNERLPTNVTIAILSGVLQGLHAAHEATNERGEPLGIVHRDVSPQNVLVGSDGQARVLDFGVAKAAGRVQTTREGQLKGKIAYMSPEQLTGEVVDRRSDIYSASVVLWESLTGQRLFSADNEGAMIARVLERAVEPPSRAIKRVWGRPDLSAAVLDELDRITLRGLAREPVSRFETALEMALALEACLAPATAAHVSTWVTRIASRVLAERAGHVAEIENSSSSRLIAPGGGGGPLPLTPLARASIPELVTIAASTSDSTSNPAQELSSITGVSTAERPRLAPAGRLGLAIAVSAVALGIGGLVAFIGIGTRAQTGGAAAQTGSVEAATAEALPAPPPPAPTMSTAIEVPAPPSASTPVASAKPAVNRPTTRGGTAASKPECNPPYTWDAEGHKHYKPECL